MIRRRQLLLGAGASALLAACTPLEGPKFEATDVTGANFGRELALTDHNGTPRTLADFHGKVLVVFFGFVHCPDVCPTTLYKFAKVVKALGPDGAKVQAVLITVDPERDTPDLLRQYVTGFDPSFLGLTGDAAAVAAAAKEFRVIYQKVPGSTPQDYSVDHSAGTYVYDPQGRLRLFVAATQDEKVLEHDIKLLLGGA